MFLSIVIARCYYIKRYWIVFTIPITYCYTNFGMSLLLRTFIKLLYKYFSYRLDEFLVKVHMLFLKLKAAT